MALIRRNPTKRTSPIRRWSRIETVLDASVPVAVKVEPVVQKFNLGELTDSEDRKTHLTRWRRLELTLPARKAFFFEPFSLLEGN